MSILDDIKYAGPTRRRLSDPYDGLNPISMVRKVHGPQQPIVEPGSYRFKRFIAVLQITVAIWCVVYLIVYRLILFSGLVRPIPLISGLARTAFILSMIATGITGCTGFRAASLTPELYHPTNMRLLNLVVSCLSGFLNITSSVTLSTALWQSSALIPFFPVQAVEVPHYGFLLAFSLLCAFVNLGMAYRFSHKLHKRILHEPDTMPKRHSIFSR